MSQVLPSQQSLDAPSRYTVFERDVFGASSPQSQKRQQPCLKSQDKAKKLKRFSEVAFAGESPNLQDVSSGLSKSKPSVLVVSTNRKSVQILEPSTSRQNFGTSSPILFDSRSGSSTPSLIVESRDESDFLRPTKKKKSRLSSPPQATQDPTGDLLTTESLIESSAVINGQPNVLRIESSPDPALPTTARLSRNQQVELSVRKAKEWLNSLPDNSDPVPYTIAQDNSMETSISRRSDAAADCTQGSVLLVAPDPTVREVRILLQRLDPQVLLRVPIRDIQNLMTQPSNLSLTNVQKTMNNLISSNKLGMTAVDQEEVRSIHASSDVSKAVNKSNRKRRSMEKKVKGKRKLFTVQRQTSDISQEVSIATDNVDAQCPYSLPTKKRGRPPKKPRKPFQKKLLPQLVKPKTASKKRSPKQKTPSEEDSPAESEQAVVPRTRSSEALKGQTTPQPNRSKPTHERNPSPSNVQRKSHEMTLRKKSNPRRTSLFFQPKSQVSKPKRPSKRNSSSAKQGPRIVCTFLHREQVDRVAAVIKRLGGTMENKVTASTTHVVCGGPKRTINLLRGIARGCWLVTYEWVLQSMGKRKWIEEEPYEVTNFSPAVQKCRIARETLGLYPNIFEKIGTIYVAPKTAPPKSELCELLKLCGAKVVTTTRRANVAVGAKIPDIQSVNEVWVLDSIQENVLLPVQRYLL